VYCSQRRIERIKGRVGKRTGTLKCILEQQWFHGDISKEDANFEVWLPIKCKKVARYLVFMEIF